jgi:hypothetical protein
MHPRRPLLKRVTLWTAAVVLLLAGYVGGSPFVAFVVERHGPPQSWRAFEVVYAPLIYIVENPNAPGHAALAAYVEWSMETLDHMFP